MFDIQNYPSFITAILLFQLIPGAGTIAILNATARNGIGAGLGAVIGTIVGDTIFMIAAVAGLAAFMKANPALFQGLQFFGAAYLCWMGIQLIRVKIHSSNLNPESKKTAWRYFRQAWIVSMTNPKVILFFFAFFPLFLKPEATNKTLFVMMAHVTIISFIYQALIVLIGNLIANHLKAIPIARQFATRFAGISLIGLGIKLALNNR
ncbi:LysE family translocator [Orrella sp. NBD-18]|uniref:LysE family translocator n=1 Tax=Sheuella amnicola TaxID=2707330 RepID=A0A6B2R418_9BURK|nr:LysE family translocator [Sheuella amnicola]NDY84474.1 LysE family translocator [Sheuella amnicola]